MPLSKVLYTRHYNGTPLERSPFDYVPEDDFNELEKDVALYLEDQDKLPWWPAFP